MKQAHKDLLLKVAGIVRQQRAREEYLVNELATKMHKESASTVAKDLVKRGIYSAEELDAATAEVSKVAHLESLKDALAIVQPEKKSLPIGEVEKVASIGARGEVSAEERKMLEDPAIQYLLQHC